MKSISGLLRRGVLGSPAVGIQRFGCVGLNNYNYKQVYSKGFSTIVSSFPSNLILADPSVLEEEKPKNPAIAKNFDPIMYNFATLKVPSSVPVLPFTANVDSVSESTALAAPLERTIFEVAIRRDIIHDVIRYIRHKRRQPKKTKRIGELRGSGKKPRAQKGQGLSQAGNQRNSAWVGGFKAHGPVIRDYSIKINRKVRALAMMMTLSAKLREENLIVFENFECQTHKTKELSMILEKNGLLEARILMVDIEFGENFARAVNNLPNVHALLRRRLNIYEILRRDKLIVTRAALEDLQEKLVMQYNYSGRRRTIKEKHYMLEEARLYCEGEEDL